MADMSSQNGIKEKLHNSDGLWTAPSKDQYLPQFFLKLSNNYNATDDATVLRPMKIKYFLQLYSQTVT